MFGDDLIVVSGAASGNGLAITRRLVADGARVVGGDINSAALEEVSKELPRERFFPMTCDVAREESVIALFQYVDSLGSLSGVVAQAGVIYSGRFAEMSCADWDGQFAVDVRGTFLCLREGIRRMMESGGTLVTMSGTYAHQAQPGVAGAVAAKAAIAGLTRAVAVEYGHLGIRCNAVMPGMVQTPMIDAYFDRKGLSDITEQKKLHSLHPMDRLVTPEEVANVVAFLCSEASSFCNGQVVAVDGGQTAGLGVRMLEELTGKQWIP